MTRTTFTDAVDDAMLKVFGFYPVYKNEDPNPLTETGFLRFENRLIDALNDGLEDIISEAGRELSAALSTSGIDAAGARRAINDIVVPLAPVILPTMEQILSPVSLDMAESTKLAQQQVNGLASSVFSEFEQDQVALIAARQLLYAEEFYLRLLPETLGNRVDAIAQQTATMQGFINELEGRVVDSFQSTHRSYNPLFSVPLLNRVRSYSSVRAFAEGGIQFLTYDNPMDERTTTFCREINGMLIPVQSALDAFDRIFEAESVDDMMDISPFVEQREQNGEIVYTLVRGSLPNVDFNPRQIDVAFLTENTTLTPPFHHLCRTLIIAA